MARPLRLQFPHAPYHVTSRGNARQKIYDDAQDRDQFLSNLAHVVSRFGWCCHAYCLMDNHYHLVIETPRANLSMGMRQLNGLYTQTYNRRHGRVGHLFQGRYAAIVVEKDAYLLELCRYVVLNPVRAKAVKQPSQWVRSSYRATAGRVAAPDWFTVCGRGNQRAQPMDAAHGANLLGSGTLCRSASAGSGHPGSSEAADAGDTTGFGDSVCGKTRVAARPVGGVSALRASAAGDCGSCRRSLFDSESGAQSTSSEGCMIARPDPQEGPPRGTPKRDPQEDLPRVVRQAHHERFFIHTAPAMGKQSN